MRERLTSRNAENDLLFAGVRVIAGEHSQAYLELEEAEDYISTLEAKNAILCKRKDISATKAQKAQFVHLLEKLVKAAMPNIKSLDLIELDGGAKHVLATCNNGARYLVCVEGNSHIAIAYDVINFLRFK